MLCRVLVCEKIKIKNFDQQKEKFLLLKENESITIVAEFEINSSINIMCKNKKLIIEFLENGNKKNTTSKK